MKYKLKSLQLLKDINYIKGDKEIKDPVNTSSIKRKVVKVLDDDERKLYYISDDALMLTIKTIFENYTLIERENFEFQIE